MWLVKQEDLNLKVEIIGVDRHLVVVGLGFAPEK